MKNKKETEEF